MHAPSFDHAKALIPAVTASDIRIAISGPMVTSGDATLGFEIATGTSIFLGTSYVIRLLAPYSPSPKEIALLPAQNLLMNEFVPSLPGIVMMPASKCRNYRSIVPNPFESIDWDAIDEIREEARRNAMAAADAATAVTGVAGAEASAVVAGEVAATVTVDAAAAATTSAGEVVDAIVGQ